MKRVAIDDTEALRRFHLRCIHEYALKKTGNKQQAKVLFRVASRYYHMMLTVSGSLVEARKRVFNYSMLTV